MKCRAQTLNLSEVQLYVYARPFIHYSILFTHVKITPQWKSTFIRRHVAYVTVAALKGGRKSAG